MTTQPKAPGAAALEELDRLKFSIDTRLNDVLCEMKPGYDDSMVGFNEAWDVVRKAFADRLAALSPAPAGNVGEAWAAWHPNKGFGSTPTAHHDIADAIRDAKGETIIDDSPDWKAVKVIISRVGNTR